MKKENSINIELFNEQIKASKNVFRQHQRDLPFDEKMKIAFSLAERDNAIRRAVPVLKTNKNKKGWK
jgi:hypothetical protein